MRRSPEDSRSKKAFTLLEALVSLAILAVIVVALAQLISATSSIWTGVMGKVSQRQSSRPILDYVTEDLKAALAPVDGSANSLQFLLNPATLIPDASKYLFPSAIFWQAPVATDTTYGDVAEVGYFIRWDESSPTNPRARLCRILINPASLTTSGTSDPDAASYLIFKQPTDWINAQVLDQVAPGIGPDYKGLLAEDVVGLWVNCLDSEGNVVSQPIGSVPHYDSRTAAGFSDKVPASGLPAAVRLSCAVLDARSASRVTPTVKADIINLVNSSEDANAFIETAMSDDRLRTIRAGVSCLQTTVYLENAN